MTNFRSDIKITHGIFPFNHWYIDDYLPRDRAHEIYQALKRIHLDQSFYKYDNIFEKKLAKDKLHEFPPVVRNFFVSQLLPDFIEWLQSLTAIKGLIADPHNVGGGYHVHKREGILLPHIDFSRHRGTGLIRRLNVILYMNMFYKPEFKGQLELWTKDMTDHVKIDPHYNRLVVFETPDAPHGFSEPWNHDTPRMSLATYFYSSPSIEDLQKEHKSTQFLRKPGEPIDPEVEKLREQRNQGRVSSNIV